MMFPLDVVAQGNNQMTICHIPPGNPSNMHTITISSSAWNAHQAHGDVIGGCSLVTFTTMSNGTWDDNSIWSLDGGQTNCNCYPGDEIDEYNVQVNHDVMLSEDITIINNGTLAVNQQGSLIGSNFSLTNYSGAVSCNGDFEVEDLTLNTGTSNVFDNITVHNIIEVEGGMTSYGELLITNANLDVNQGGSLEAFGSITLNGGGVSNEGTITLNSVCVQIDIGNFENKMGSTLAGSGKVKADNGNIDNLQNWSSTVDWCASGVGSGIPVAEDCYNGSCPLDQPPTCTYSVDVLVSNGVPQPPLVVDSGEVLCLTGTGTYSGTVTVNNGGHLVVCNGVTTVFGSIVIQSGGHYWHTSSSQVIGSFINNGTVHLGPLNCNGCTPTFGTDTITACDSYIWIDGNTYSSSINGPTHLLTNAAGCDSTVTLNLVINSSSSGVDTVIANPPYTWIDGVTYTASNYTATHVLSNSVGCDSTITLNLTIASNYFASNNSMSITTGLNDTWTATWIDFDGDGDQDLFLPQYETSNGNYLYRNDGSDFTLITSGEAYNDLCSGLAVTCADVDNDGDRDCFVSTNISGLGKLLINDGNGQFNADYSDPTATNTGYHHGAAFADYNNDGYVDLFLSDFMSTNYNLLYKNTGNGFELIENDELSNSSGRTIGATWADYDNDGDQDLFIPNGNLENNLFFINNGDGSFTEETGTTITTDAANCVGSAWGDYDNDGYLDLFVANAGNAPNFLYHNDGNGSFTQITSGEVVTDIGSSHGCSWADFDNDGDLDLYVSNDQKLYVNDGLGNFNSNASEVITQPDDYSYGHSWADFDNDGDLDLYVTTHSTNYNKFYTNNGNSNNWFKCKLVGTNSNRSAIGTRVRVKVNGSWQIREVNSQSGFGGQHSMIQHFGLGLNSVIDTLVIKWPSGYIQTATNIAANQMLTVVEEDAALVGGYAFKDVNLNCVKDIGEVGISGCEVIINPGNIKLCTDENGYYECRLAVGTYSITQSLPSYWTESSCFSGVPNFTVNSISDVLVNNNISSVPLSVGTDLEVNLSHSDLRKGFQNQMTVTYKNGGTQDHSVNSEVTVFFPQEVVPLSAVPPWSSSNGMNYTWIITPLTLSQSGTIKIIDSTSVLSDVGDFVDFWAYISKPDGDLNPANNSKMLTQEIMGPIDPNDMLSWPSGLGENSFIGIDQLLTYRVRFQNVGNYPVQNAVITNRIKSDLDINSFNMTGASHQVDVEINNREIIFRFDDILLPDSSTNEVQSHGFVEYTILPDPLCMNGTVLNNQASIIFDFEKAIETNITRHVVLNPDENLPEILIVPNPSRGDVTLYSESLQEVNRIEVVNGTGKVVYIPTFEQNNLGVYMQTDKLITGVYVLRIYQKNEEVKVARMVISN